MRWRAWMIVPRCAWAAKHVSRSNYLRSLGAALEDRPRPHRFDEFPAGYSLAGCAPAGPASVLPAGAHLAANSLGGTIEMQRTANSALTVCLTRGTTPVPGACGRTLQGSSGSQRRNVPKVAKRYCSDGQRRLNQFIEMQAEAGDGSTLRWQRTERWGSWRGDSRLSIP